MDKVSKVGILLVILLGILGLSIVGVWIIFGDALGWAYCDFPTYDINGKVSC